MNPLVLVSDKPVFYKEDDYGTGEWYAYVEAQMDNKGHVMRYVLHYHPFNCFRMFTQTTLLRGVSYETLKVGILAHEVAHIMSGALLAARRVSNPLMDYIFNVVLDSHDEWFLSRRYPAYAPYVQVALLALHELPPAKNRSQLKEYLDALYDFVRFGVVDEKVADEEWVNFFMRCVIPAIRGETCDVVVATEALYYWLVAKIGNAHIGNQSLPKQGKTVLSEKDIERICALPQWAVSSVRDIAEQYMQGGSLFLPGREIARIDHVSADAFYRTVTTRYYPTIVDIADRFEEYVNYRANIKTYEGEMNLAPDNQVSAYVGSFTGEETRTYTRKAIRTLDGRIAILADVSFSTDKMKEVYACARIIFLAAFERLSSVKTALVLFNGEAVEIAGFEHDLSQRGCAPQAAGGTCLMPALSIARGYEWGDGFKIQFVLTDGYIEDWGKALELVHEMEQKGVLTFLVEIVEQYDVPVRQDYQRTYQSTIKDLPLRLSEYTLAVMEQELQVRKG